MTSGLSNVSIRLPMSSLRTDLPLRIFLGLFLGVFVGLFFGEPAAGLQPVADACLRLMQM